MSTIIEEDIKGHHSVKVQLNQALEKGKLAHALLFSGPSGVGKREMAWALAQKLLCEKAKSPCGTCHQCLSLLKKENENVLCITHETLQIRLQDVKGITSFLSLQSFAKAKVVLIDSAEKLNLQAGNFLLKIIEEPPPKSFFFFISSTPSKLPLTIRSRLQNLRFQALSEDIVAELSPPEVPQWMIRGCRGRMDLLEQLKDQEEIRSQAFDLWRSIFQHSFSALSLDFSNQIKDRKEALAICRFWQQILRDARFFKLGQVGDLIHGDHKKALEKISQFPTGTLDNFIQKTLEMEKDLQANADYTLCFENFVVDMKETLKY